MLLKKAIELMVLLCRDLPLFHFHIRVPMVQNHTNAAFGTHVLQHIAMGHIENDDPFDIESALHKFGGPVVHLLHRRPDGEVLLAMRIDFVIALQTFSAELFHLYAQREEKRYEFSMMEGKVREKSTHGTLNAITYPELDLWV